MTVDDAYDMGRSDGEQWVAQNSAGALVGEHENLVPDDVYPAYVRGVGAGIRDAAAESVL